MYGRNLFFPSDFILFSAFRVCTLPRSGIFCPLGCCSWFGDVTQIGSMGPNPWTFFFFFWKEKLSFSWIGAARSRCGGRTHMKNPVQGSPVQRKAMSADRDGYSKISIIFSSGNPADAVTFCSAPTKVQVGPPLHLLLI